MLSIRYQPTLNTKQDLPSCGWFSGMVRRHEATTINADEQKT